jgi:UDP-glucuronate decarboxylase
MMRALANQSLTVYGDGMQTRSFCYADDMIRAFDCLMHSPDGFSSPVNLGNRVEHTMLEPAESIIALSKSRSSVVLKPLPSNGQVRRRPGSGSCVRRRPMKTSLWRPKR